MSAVNKPDSAASAIAARIKSLAPGIALSVAITLVSLVLQQLEERVFSHPYLEALVIAILIGIAVRSFWEPDQRWRPGIAFSAKQVLELAVVLLGATISFSTIAASGLTLISAIVITVGVILAASYGISRMLGLPVRLSILVACGNSICGNSAIAAIAPVIGANGDDIVASISFTAILGVVIVLGLPLLLPLLALSPTQYGILAGLTVYAVPQVLAATVPVGLISTQIGTLVKLVRVLTLGPIVVGFSLLGRGLRQGAGRAGGGDRLQSASTGALVHHRLFGSGSVSLVRNTARCDCGAGAEGGFSADGGFDGRAGTGRRYHRAPACWRQGDGGGDDFIAFVVDDEPLYHPLVRLTRSRCARAVGVTTPATAGDGHAYSSVVVSAPLGYQTAWPESRKAASFEGSHAGSHPPATPWSRRRSAK